MKLYDAAWLIPSVAADRRRVAQYGTYDGRTPGKYFDRCRAYHQPNGTVMIFTRDVGHHSSGWWKSPELETPTRVVKTSQ